LSLIKDRVNMDIRTAACLVYLMGLQLLGSINGIQIKNSEEAPFTDNEGLYRQFQLLNNAVKRQTSNSCSCTCETKPVLRQADDNMTHHQSADRTNEMAKILRTGVGKVASVGQGSGSPTNKADDTDRYRILKTHKVADVPVSDARVHDPDHEDISQEDYSHLWPEDWQSDPDQHLSDESMDSNNNMDNEESWGHNSRFAWRLLPDRMCFRESCHHDTDCCQGFNICDKSAKVCVDCWYGSSCTTEQQCCRKYPYCKKIYGDEGQCVSQL